MEHKEVKKINLFKNKRLKCGLTQQQLADRTLCSRKDIINIENYKSLPHYWKLNRIARYLGFTSKELGKFVYQFCEIVRQKESEV